MSSAERVMLTPAYVLHQHDWHETSRVVEIFSRDHGRLGVVARGARRTWSPWRAALRPFQALLLSWSGGGELVTLTGAETPGESLTLSGPALMSGFYMNELLLRLLPRRDSQPELYRHYSEALTHLMRAAAPALRVFEKQLLSALGYGLNLDREAVSGQPLRTDAVYRYELERGPVLTPATISEGLYISGAALMALAREDFGQTEQLHEVRKLLRTALERLLGERPLRTRAMMRAFTRSGVGPPDGMTGVTR